MSLFMDAKFRILKKTKTGAYEPMKKADIPYMSVGGFTFCVDGKSIYFDWDAFAVQELPNNIFVYASGYGCFANNHSLSDCYKNQWQELGLSKEDINAALLSRADRIEDFFIMIDDENGKKVSLGSDLNNSEEENAYKLELLSVQFSDDSIKWLRVKDSVLEQFNHGIIPDAVYQQIAKDVKAYLDFFGDTSKVYAFAVPADQITQEQYEKIARIAKRSYTKAIYNAAVEVLGLNPALCE